MKPIQVHKAVKYLRSVLGWNQQTLAENANCSRSCVANCEIEANIPELPTVVQFAEALGVATDVVIFGPDEAALRLNRERTIKKMSLEGLAALSHVPAKTLQQAELGMQGLNAAHIHAVAKACNISPKKLIPGKRRLVRL